MITAITVIIIPGIFDNIVFGDFENDHYSQTDNGFADWKSTIFCERK